MGEDAEASFGNTRRTNFCSQFDIAGGARRRLIWNPRMTFSDCSMFFVGHTVCSCRLCFIGFVAGTCHGKNVLRATLRGNAQLKSTAHRLVNMGRAIGWREAMFTVHMHCKCLLRISLHKGIKAPIRKNSTDGCQNGCLDALDH